MCAHWVEPLSIPNIRSVKSCWLKLADAAPTTSSMSWVERSTWLTTCTLADGEPHLCIIGLMGGAKAEANLGYMLSRRLSVHATSPAHAPTGRRLRFCAVCCRTCYR